ncbi:MAG: transposase [Nitrospirae bacterium]|nr:transposase [Candidatus Troglogloeales bacterium]
MKKKTRRNHDASFKTRVVLEVIKALKTFAELGSEFNVHPNQIRNWKNEFLEKASVVFSENKDDKEELKRYGRAEIFNTDQGSQYTSEDFTGILGSFE